MDQSSPSSTPSSSQQQQQQPPVSSPDDSTVGSSSGISSDSHNHNNNNVNSNDYAFLVHSQDTLPNNLPPEVDNKPLARQKRRRTSPEDQAILEAEYQQNPKPDKAARLTIVEKVALGEKEVQIWFQNRRQNVRRKAKPLSAEELLLQRTLDSTPQPITEMATAGAVVTTSNVEVDRIDSISVRPTLPTASSSGIDLLYQSARSMAVGLDGSQDIKSLVSQSALEPTSDSTSIVDSKNMTMIDGDVPMIRRGSIRLPNPPGTVLLPVSSKIRSSYGPLPRELRSAANIKTNPVPARGHGLRRTSSSVHLRLSVDGKAEVVADDDNDQSVHWGQPTTLEQVVKHDDPLTMVSPAMQQQQQKHQQISHVRAHTLQRSQSVILASESFKSASLSTTELYFPRPRAPGSSNSRRGGGIRDWDIFCDTSNKDVLPASSSSTTNLRSAASPRDVATDVRAVNRHRNVARPGKSGGNPRSRLVGTRYVPGSKVVAPILTRATSSLARLQTDVVGGHHDHKRPRIKARMSTMDSLGKPSSTKACLCGDDDDVVGDGNDSDKENWAPDDGEQPRGSQTFSYHRGPRAVLRDSVVVPAGEDVRASSLSNTSNRACRRGRPSTMTTKGDAKLEVMAAVTAKGGSDHRAGDDKEGDLNLPAEDDDLNCVQSLLALSQGSWR